MIKRHIILEALLLLAFCLPVAAAETTIPSLTVGPLSYKNVKVLGANATDLYFTHDQGIGNVKLKYLSPDLQKQFHYNPRAAAEAEKRQAEADALYQSSVAANIAAQIERSRHAQAAETNSFVLSDPVSERSLVGKTAPKFNFEKWAGEKPVTEGKYVLVTFWAPWSTASKQCLADLNALQKKFADKLAIVGVTTNSAAEIQDLKDSKPSFPTTTDERGTVQTAAGVTSIPSVLLIDTRGIVRYEGHPAALTEKRLQSLLSMESK